MDHLVQLDRATIWHPYTQQHTAPDPLLIESAHGVWLHSADGRRILDLIASGGVAIHGHTHAAIAQAIAEQAQRLGQVSFTGFTHAPAVHLAERLVALLPGDLSRVFFSDNGSTAIEVAMKMAVQYFANQGQGQRSRFMVFQGGYHGDTVGAMSAGATSGLFNPWKSMLFSVLDLPWPGTWLGDEQAAARELASLAALERQLDLYGTETAALIVEPLVQGAGGMNMARARFFQQVIERVRAAGILVICDEALTGFGRCGSLFASEQLGITPDMVCLAKGLSGGFLPLAATVCREFIYQGFLADEQERAFSHGHAYSANPLACAAALASLQGLCQPTMQQTWARIEAQHTRHLRQLQEHPLVQRARVCGSIAAFDLQTPIPGVVLAQRLRQWFLQQGLLLRPLGNVVYLMPPYCISEEQLEQAWCGVTRTLDSLLSEQMAKNSI